ncbi:hypothetical protein F5Y13DRAFT_162497 [Hypoxylon sp. FL1857]|nr:hypothetical protein F5Y13DRAFT_162497 [Hypoxylon sp. FL1857]
MYLPSRLPAYMCMVLSTGTLSMYINAVGILAFLSTVLPTTKLVSLLARLLKKFERLSSQSSARHSLNILNPPQLFRAVVYAYG